MLFLLDGRYVQVRHLQRKGDLFYFNPSHLMRKAGYEAAPLGRDRHAAIVAAAGINARWDQDNRRTRRHHGAAYEQERGFVYFLSAGPAIKVGYSREPTSRISALKTTSAFAIELLGKIVGTRRLELEIHRQLKKYCRAGGGREWFDDVPEVRAIIAKYLHPNDCSPRPAEPIAVLQP